MSSAALFADEVYSINKQGNELYKKGNFDSALKKYDDALLVAPADTFLKMNRGSTLYRLGRLEEADSTYTGTLSVKNKRKQADAYYNLGNIQFKEGDLLMQSGQDGSEKYKSALQHYIAALDLRPDDKEAKWNIELTQRRIKQQQQQQKNQQDQDKKNNQDKKDQNKQNQDKQDKQDKNKDQNDQNKKDQNKQDQQNQNSQNDKQQQQQPPKPKPNDNKEAMKKKEAERIIAQFADDADSLNKPPKKQDLGMKLHKPEKDW